uniref:Uncharacterized protein n=1 Tax=Pararge aegeria TaxID=116150 RepID=S4PDL1_9NEOP
MLSLFTVQGIRFPTSRVTKLIEFTMDLSGQMIFGWFCSLLWSFPAGRKYKIIKRASAYIRCRCVTIDFGFADVA